MSQQTTQQPTDPNQAAKEAAQAIELEKLRGVLSSQTYQALEDKERGSK